MKRQSENAMLGGAVGACFGSMVGKLLIVSLPLWYVITACGVVGFVVGYIATDPVPIFRTISSKISAISLPKFPMAQFVQSIRTPRIFAIPDAGFYWFVGLATVATVIIVIALIYIALNDGSPALRKEVWIALLVSISIICAAIMASCINDHERKHRRISWLGGIDCLKDGKEKDRLRNITVDSRSVPMVIGTMMKDMSLYMLFGTILCVLYMLCFVPVVVGYVALGIAYLLWSFIRATYTLRRIAGGISGSIGAIAGITLFHGLFAVVLATVAGALSGFLLVGIAKRVLFLPIKFTDESLVNLWRQCSGPVYKLADFVISSGRIFKPFLPRMVIVSTDAVFRETYWGY